MRADLAAILNHPANRQRLARAAKARLLELESQEAEQAAERERQALQGTAADNEREKLRCAAGAEGCIYWFNTWVWTYNPKLVGTFGPDGGKVSPYLRFKLFPRQEALIRWAFARMANQEQGAVPKSRDVGASYLFAGIALHQWLFEDGFSATFGSRIMDNVDKSGNPDAIFEKLRIMLRRLPGWMLPAGFNWTRDSKIGLLINPDTGATITGEGGENMGRAGRSTFFVGDEFGFVPNAEAVEAALSGNTDCVFWVSSANGPGNLFARKCSGNLPPEQVFRLHYTDDPRKTPEWVAKKKASMEPVNWASEYEIDFTASLEGVCIPGLWVASCQELARRLRPKPSRLPAVGGLDVGAGGKGKSVFVSRHGPWVRRPKSRGDPDTIGTATWAMELAIAEGCGSLYYDAPGVGVGVTSALKHVPIHASLKVYPVNTGERAPTSRIWPDGVSSHEKFGNLKAEIWWLTRTRAQKSHELLLFMNGQEEGVDHPVDECLLLPSGDGESTILAAQLSMVKAETNLQGKIVIESKASLKKRGIPSPDYGDAICLAETDKRPRYNLAALA